MIRMHEAVVWAGAAVMLAGSMSLESSARSLSSPSQKEDGVAVRVNPQRTGSIEFAAGFSAPLMKLWSVETNSGFHPLIAAGRVFLALNGTQANARDVSSGKPIWQQTLPDYSVAAAYDNGKLFFLGTSGNLTALSADAGEQIWTNRIIVGDSTDSPVAVDGRVFITGSSIAAFDENTGYVRWSGLSGGTSGSVAVGDGGVYTGSPCQYYKYTIRDGALLWHDDNGCVGGGGISPAYFKKRVYFVDWAEGNFVLDSSSGAYVGSFAGAIPPTFFTGGNGRSYALEITNGKVYCINVKTGDVTWSFTNGDLYGQVPIAINGQPVVGTNTGMVYMFDGVTGAQLWSANMKEKITALNAGDGVLVVATQTKVTVFAPQ